VLEFQKHPLSRLGAEQTRSRIATSPMATWSSNNGFALSTVRRQIAPTAAPKPGSESTQPQRSTLIIRKRRTQK
jgi:hypothetical protein